MILHQVRAVLPFGFVATFSFSSEQKLAVEWEPDIPRITQPRAQRKFFAAYQRERDAFMADIATMTGKNMATVDVSGRGMVGLAVAEPRARH